MSFRRRPALHSSPIWKMCWTCITGRATPNAPSFAWTRPRSSWSPKRVCPLNKQLLNDAHTALNAADDLLVRMDNAGFVMFNQLHDINAAVDAQLVKSEPDPSTVAATIGKFGSWGAALAPGFALPAGKSAVQTQAGEVTSAIESSLRQALMAVQAFLADASARARLGGNATKCNVAVAGGLTLAISSDVLVLQRGDKFDVAVLTSKSPTPHAVVSGPSGGVSAAVNSMVTRVTVDQSAAPGDYLVTVSDPDSGTSQQFRVTVQGPAKPTVLTPPAAIQGRSPPGPSGAATQPKTQPTPPTSSDLALVGLGKLDPKVPATATAFATRVAWLHGCKGDADNPPSTVLTPALRGWLSLRQPINPDLPTATAPSNQDCPLFKS
jgi:hypothetical protein